MAFIAPMKFSGFYCNECPFLLQASLKCNIINPNLRLNPPFY